MFSLPSLTLSNPSSIPCPPTGQPSPLGPSKQGSAINFALYAKFATSVQLCLFDSEHKSLGEVPLSKSGDVWHVALEGLPGIGICYGYRVSGKGGWDTGFRCV